MFAEPEANQKSLNFNSINHHVESTTLQWCSVLGFTKIG